MQRIINLLFLSLLILMFHAPDMVVSGNIHEADYMLIVHNENFTDPNIHYGFHGFPPNSTYTTDLWLSEPEFRVIFSNQIVNEPPNGTFPPPPPTPSNYTAGIHHKIGIGTSSKNILITIIPSEQGVYLLKNGIIFLDGLDAFGFIADTTFLRDLSVGDISPAYPNIHVQENASLFTVTDFMLGSFEFQSYYQRSTGFLVKTDFSSLSRFPFNYTINQIHPKVQTLILGTLSSAYPLIVLPLLVLVRKKKLV